MAYAFVASRYSNNTNAVNFSGTTVAGNLLVAVVGYDGGTGGITSVGSMTLLAEIVDGGNYVTSFWYYPNNPGSLTSQTITWSGSTPGTRRAWSAEFSGIATSSPLITSASQVQASPGTGTDAVTSGSTTVTLPNSAALILGWSSSIGGSPTLAAGTGFTGRSWTTGSPGFGALLEDKRITSSGSQAATATASGTPADIHTWMVAFTEPSASVSITPSAGSLSLVGVAPSVTQQISRIPSAATLSLTGIVPVLSQGVVRSPSVGAISISGAAPTLTLSGSVTRTPQVGALGFTGYTSTQDLGVPAPVTGSLGFTGNAATVSQGTVRAPAVGSLSVSGIASTLRLGIVISPAAGTISLSGNQATVVNPVSIVPQAGALSLTGITPSLSIPGLRVPSTGALSFIGLAPTVVSPIRITPSSSALTFSGITPYLLGRAKGTRYSSLSLRLRLGL